MSQSPYGQDNPAPPPGLGQGGDGAGDFTTTPIGGFFSSPNVGPGTGQGSIMDALGRQPGDPGFDVSTARLVNPQGTGGFGGGPGAVPTGGGPATAVPKGGFDAAGNFVGDSTVTDATGTSALGTAGTAGSSAAIQKLLQALIGAGGVIAGHVAATSGAGSAVPPQLSQLLQTGVNRAQYQNPLFQAMTNGAYQMLPDFAKTGTKPPSGTI